MRRQKRQSGYARVMNSVGIDDGGEEEPHQSVIRIKTVYGPMQVTIEGNIKDNPHIFLTYHDIGLTHETCFRRFFNKARRTYNVFNKFAVVHIDAPGQHEEASRIPDEIMEFDMDVLASQIDKVLEKLKIKHFIAFGVGAGAYILGLYATRNPSRVQALVLAGAMCNACGWIEWSQKWYALYFEKIADNSFKKFFLNRWFNTGTLQNNLDLIDFYSASLDLFSQITY